MLCRLGVRCSQRSSLLQPRHRPSPFRPYSQIRILGIETSCDDTAIAIVNSERQILSEYISTQNEAHKQIKGIIPSVAAEKHRLEIDGCVKKALEMSNLHFNDLTAIAFTRGPGMGVCLEVGLRKAKELAMQYQKPVVAVNHMEGHALVARIAYTDLSFPFLTLLISGGHTQLLVCHGVGRYTLLGTTLDDPIGEAFDKVARLLNLDWDGGGGKAIEKAALKGTKKREFIIARPMSNVKNCNFSFSGIKTAVRTLVTQHTSPDKPLDPEFVSDIAFSFQNTILNHLSDRVERALEWCANNSPVSKFVVSGGVASNQQIRNKLAAIATKYKVQLYFPPKNLCTDNGVMIAWAGMENYLCRTSTFTYEEAQTLKFEPKWKLDATPRDLFPGAHKRDPIQRKITRLPGIIGRCEKLIGEDKFEKEVFQAAISSALELKLFDKAWVFYEVACKHDKNFEKLKQRMEAYIETKTYFQS